MRPRRLSHFGPATALNGGEHAVLIENPQPGWLPLLLLALPGIGFAAYALNGALFPRENRPLCTIPAIGIVLALLPTHLLALAFASLSAGLAVAWSGVGIVGYMWITRHWREFRSAFSHSPAGLRRKLWVTGLATLPIVPLAIFLDYSDEAYHHAIIAHLQNGTYPPRYLYDPSLPLRYHYAFDLAAAIITGLLRLRLDHAIDLLTIALWPCMFLLLWRIGEHVGGRRAGLPVALAVCFAGGWPLLVPMGSPCGICAANGLWINPPFIHYFFQHPWGIGVPIFCLVMLQRAALPRLRNRPLGLVALGCSLSLLSLSETVLFVTTLAPLGAIEAWRLVRSRHRDAASVLITVGASLLGAKLMGGFFISGNYPPAGGLFGMGFSVRDFPNLGEVIGQIQWNLASFGLLLVLGTIGLLRATNDKAFLIILAGLGLIISNSLVYEHSWDIVKFGTVSFIVLAIGAGIFLCHLVGWANNFARRGIVVALVVALAGEGATYPIIMLSAYDPAARTPFSVQIITPYLSHKYPVDPDDARAVSFLRRHMGPSEIAYRAAAKFEPYAIWGGLATEQPWDMYASDSRDNDMYGLGRKKFVARKDLTKISENWLERLAAEKVTWIVTDSGDTEINAILERTEGQHMAALVAQYGDVRVYHLYDH
jgi:hypothetical protein